jgi:hypothetical protein
VVVQVAEAAAQEEATKKKKSQHALRRGRQHNNVLGCQRRQCDNVDCLTEAVDPRGGKSGGGGTGTGGT